MTIYVPKWATCERCGTFRPRSEVVRDRQVVRRWTCKSCPSETLDNGHAETPGSSPLNGSTRDGAA